MDLHEIREALKTTTIYKLPLRVTYYARVSSESDMQLNSLENQITYYEDFIKKNPEWTFVPGYVDEGISGMSTKKRMNFNRMIIDASDKKFDLIITKEISRFARNTVDSISFTRKLLSYGVCVFFQNDNINTANEESEFIMTLMSGMAQDELRKLSSRVKFGHKQAIKNHVVLGNSRIFGYIKNNKKLVIDEEQAQMVRELFELYASNNYSLKQIEKIFWEKGYRNLNGNKIWHTTMSNMIANPKYKGYYVGNKVKIVDMFTKKQKFLPESEWVMFKDETGEIVPAIVSEDVWNRANEILKQRSEDIKSRRGVYTHEENVYTGKIVCTHCNKLYYRKDIKDRKGNKVERWVCSNKINNGKDSCPSLTIRIDEINQILFDVFKDTKDVSAKMVRRFEEMYRNMVTDGNLAKKIKETENKIAFAEKKKAKLLELVTLDSISPKDFKAMSEKCNQDIEQLNIELDDLHNQEVSTDDFRKHMEKIREVLKNAEKDVTNGIITREFVETFVDKIYVTPIDNTTMRLDVKIFTGNSTEKYIEKLTKRTKDNSTKRETEKVIENSETIDEDGNLVCRTGHIINKMCPIRNTNDIEETENDDIVGRMGQMTQRTYVFQRNNRTVEKHKLFITYCFGDVI